MKIINPFNKRNVHGLWLLVTSNSNRRSVVTVSLISLSWVFTIERKHLQQCLTSWCRVVCHCQLAAGACWELSCCEPQISCRCGRTCPESRSYWPAGYWVARPAWVHQTWASRLSSFGERTHRWCTPEGHRSVDFIYLFFTIKNTANNSPLLWTLCLVEA